MQIDKSIDSKISFALEKIFTAYRFLIWNKVKDMNLSPIQLQFILYLHKYPKKMRKVSTIALEFALTKATVSDAIKSLKMRKLINKIKDKKDKRIYIINLTEKGKRLAESIEIWDRPIKKILSSFTMEEKERIFSFFIKLIDSLRKQGVVKVARMCISCSHFKRDFFPDRRKPHFCELTGIAISDIELNIDCVYHKLVNSKRDTPMVRQLNEKKKKYFYKRRKNYE